MMVNFLVACSNIVALHIFLDEQITAGYKWFAGVIVLASICMHLSERKHGLPGLYPFNLYSTFFLWLDRCMALLALLFVARVVFLQFAVLHAISMLGSASWVSSACCYQKWCLRAHINSWSLLSCTVSGMCLRIKFCTLLFV